MTIKGKGKVFPYQLPSVGPGAEPGVQAISPHVTAVTFPAKERHRPLTSTKLYCSVTEAHRCKQLAQGCYAALFWWQLNPRPIDRLTHYVTCQ